MLVSGLWNLSGLADHYFIFILLVNLAISNITLSVKVNFGDVGLNLLN